MRFELAAAYAMGIALPLLEVLRRRTNFDTISGYVDDFIAGGLLLYAARAVSRRKPRGPVLLVAAPRVVRRRCDAVLRRDLERPAVVLQQRPGDGEVVRAVGRQRCEYAVRRDHELVSKPRALRAGERRIIDRAAHEQRMRELHAERARVPVRHVRQPHPVTVCVLPRRRERDAAAALRVAHAIARAQS